MKLDREIRSLAQQEREILSQLLPKIREMDLSQGYLDLGYSSLFAYIIDVGYSEGSANRRIKAARLMRDVPELPEKLESGAIKLSQVALVSQAARQSEKAFDHALIEKLENKNTRESEKIVAQFFDLPVIEHAKTKTQADESVRIELTVSKELYEKLMRAQELLSHKVPSGQLVDLIEHLTDKALASKAAPATPSTATAAVTDKRRKQVLNEEPECAICGGKWQLQVDHIRPKWAGGSNERENLQTLCAKHNRMKYRRELTH